MDEITEEQMLEISIDTYAVLILVNDPIEYALENGGAAYLFDPEDVLSDQEKLVICSLMLTVFEEFEHYEKCQDIKEYIDGI